MRRGREILGHRNGLGSLDCASPSRLAKAILKLARIVMNARMSGLFSFGKKENATATAHKNAAKSPAPAETADTHHRAKSAVAEMIAERAKPDARNDRITARPARQERRHRRRVKISAPVRVRQVNVQHATEFDLTMTADVSREGILFETSRTTYQRGQEVAVVFPYRALLPGEQAQEQRGQVVRVVRASENRYGVAVAFIDGEPAYELVDALGNPLGEKQERMPVRSPKPSEKPLVIHVDVDQRVRAIVRAELESHGYTVESLPDPSSAAALLRQRMPAALISEAESFAGALPGGGEMSGYDLCVLVRRNAKFAHVPVILTTRTGAPSDFSTAHALGATVCVSKPYDLNRVANLLRMLAPIEA
jgi:twitching motility two-component system response regulator PilG